MVAEHDGAIYFDYCFDESCNPVNIKPLYLNVFCWNIFECFLITQFFWWMASNLEYSSSAAKYSKNVIYNDLYDSATPNSYLVLQFIIKGSEIYVLYNKTKFYFNTFICTNNITVVSIMIKFLLYEYQTLFLCNILHIYLPYTHWIHMNMYFSINFWKIFEIVIIKLKQRVQTHLNLIQLAKIIVKQELILKYQFILLFLNLFMTSRCFVYKIYRIMHWVFDGNNPLIL